MLKIVDATHNLDLCFIDHSFDLTLYQEYIEKIIQGGFKMILDDISQYDFKKDVLPIIGNIQDHRLEIKEIQNNFKELTKGLDQKIESLFHKKIDATIVLYLGLCNGAGWVKEHNEKTYVLLGIEKIIELSWGNKNDMIGLIYHELGHVYQKQYGILERPLLNKHDEMLWQLFIEGIAMVFEQKLMNNDNYYHQNKNGWLPYLSIHLNELKNDFNNDLIKHKNDQYFGDWCNYHGFGDAGYYLGSKFVKYILRSEKFDDIISFDLPDVHRYWKQYLKETA